MNAYILILFLWPLVLIMFRDFLQALQKPVGRHFLENELVTKWK